MGHSKGLRLGKRKQLKKEGWVSDWVKPCGKWWKRRASKKARRSKNVANGGSYKKRWGWIEWS